MAQTKRTGQFGDVFLIPDSPTVITAEACGNITALPGDDTPYPTKQFYQITAAAHQILDPQVPVVVKNSAVAVSANNYVVHYGTGIIEFFTPLSGTPSITVDGAYFPTTGVLTRNGSCRDWTFTVTSADVDGSEYGTGFGAHFAGMANGTFNFTKFQTELSLYQKFRSASRVLMIFYESVRAPSYWVTFGRILSFPNAAPIGGMISGQVSGVLTQFPDYNNISVG